MILSTVVEVVALWIGERAAFPLSDKAMSAFLGYPSRLGMIDQTWGPYPISAGGLFKSCLEKLGSHTTSLWNFWTMKLPTRIAILEADTPPDDIVARYGRYGKVFRTLLETAADELGTEGFSRDSLELSAYDVVTKQEYPDLGDVDAVLISGSSECCHGKHRASSSSSSGLMLRRTQLV